MFYVEAIKEGKIVAIRVKHVTYINTCQSCNILGQLRFQFIIAVTRSNYNVWINVIKTKIIAII